MSVLADISNLFRTQTRSRRGGWVGVDIGTATITLVEVERRGASYRLARNVLIRRPSEVAAAAPHEAFRGLGDLLQQHLTAAHPFAGKTAACVLSMSATPLQSLELPFGSPDELREMAALEMGDAADPNGRTMSVDCWTAPGVGKDGLVPVYAMSVDEDLAVGIAENLWESGLRTHVLDGVPFALARAARMAAETEAAPVAALDWGSSTATFTVAQAGKPLYARVFRDCGFAPVLQAVAQGFGVPTEDAEQLLVEFGLPDRKSAGSRLAEVQATVHELTAGTLNQISDELARTVGFLKTQGGKLVPKRLWLFGGGGTIGNVARSLSELSGLTVDPWTLPETSANRTAMPLWGTAAALSSLGCEP